MVYLQAFEIAAAAVAAAAEAAAVQHCCLFIRLDVASVACQSNAVPLKPSNVFRRRSERGAASYHCLPHVSCGVATTRPQTKTIDRREDLFIKHFEPIMH